MRRTGSWALAGGAASILLAIVLFDPTIFTGGDNAAYYALARALATGRGYVDLISPGQPIETVYPPGYPLLLVPFYWLFGGDMLGLKLESLVAAAVALWATWSIARHDPGVPTWAAAAAVWLVGLAPVFLIYTHWVLSDMSYTAVALLSLAFFQRAIEPRNGGPWSGWWLAGSLTAVLAFAVRTAGLALLVAPVGWALMTRQWRRAAWAAGIAVLAAVPWLYWSAQRPPTSGGYFQQATASSRLDPESEPVPLIEIADRVRDNLVHYAGVDFPRLFWPTPGVPTAVRALSLMFGILLLGLGGWHLYRTRRFAVWDFYLIFTIGILLVWSWTGDRFFLTIAPLLWLLLLTGLDRASRAISGMTRPAVVAAGLLALWLLVGGLRTVPEQWEITQTWLDDEITAYDPFWQDYFLGSEWIGNNAPDAVILARKPTLAWFFSGRPSTVFPFHGDPDRTWRFIRDKGITHILMDPFTRDFLSPVLAPHLEYIEIVHATPNRTVFVVRIAPPE